MSYTNAQEEQAILAPLLPDGGTLADIGAGNGTSCSNSYWLLKKGTWRGELWECDEIKLVDLHVRRPNFPGINIHERAFTPEDARTLPHLDFLTLDVDGNDYWLLKAVLEFQRPPVVIVEVNNQLPPPLKLCRPYDTSGRYRNTCFYGMSLCAAISLLEPCGYKMEAYLGDNLIATLRSGPSKSATTLWEEARSRGKDRIHDEWLTGCLWNELETRLEARFGAGTKWQQLTN